MARFTIRTSLLLVSLMLGLLGGSLWAQSSDMPLGDVVKLKKTSSRKAAHLFTNEDLPKASPQEAPASEAAAETGEQAAAADAAEPAAADDTAARIAELKRREAVEADYVKELEAKLQQDDLSDEQRRFLFDGLQFTKERLLSYQNQRAALEHKLKSEGPSAEVKPEAAPEKAAGDEQNASEPQETKAPE